MAGNFLNRDRLPVVKRVRWADHLLRPALLTAMVTSLSVAMVNLVRAVAPAWHGTYFLAGMVLVTVEAIYSYIVLRRYGPLDISPVRYRLVEWGLLVVLLKLLTYSNQSWAFILSDLQTIARAPLTFFSPALWLFLLLCGMAWGAATSTMHDFEALYDPFTFRRERIVPLENLRTRFFWGGAILLVLSGLTHWITVAGAESLLDLRRPSLGGILLNVLFYFVLGLVMLSQAQLTVHLTRWEIQQVRVAGNVVRRWVRYGAVILVAVGSVVFFLPTRYSLGLLDSARYGLLLLVALGMGLMRLLLFLLALPF
ncbi:MAG: hypothetical protein D6796_13005, partial [Caldilineae bacterium]